MSEEAKELPQGVAPEAAQPEEASTGQTKQTETPDKSVTEGRRSIWDKLFNRKTAVTAATGAAVAAGIAMAPSANAETQEKPTTSISQEDKSEEKKTTYFTDEDTSDTVTEKNGEVIKVEHDGVGKSGYALSKVDGDTIKVKGSDDPRAGITEADSAKKGVEELSALGMDIENVKKSNDKATIEVTVDDADKLNRSQKDNFDEKNIAASVESSDTVTEQNGEVIKVDHDGKGESGYTLSKVDEDTINVLGSDDPRAGITGADSAKKGEEKLAALGMDIENVEKSNDKSIIEVTVDNADNLNNVTKEKE